MSCFLPAYIRKAALTPLHALAILKPDHACLIPARLHQIGNCKKIAGMDLVSCQWLEGNLKELFWITTF